MPKRVATAKRLIKASNGRKWEAEICLHSGTGGQAPRLMVVFRDPVRVAGDRYTLMPPGSAKKPKQASQEISDAELGALLMRSVPLETF